MNFFCCFFKQLLGKGHLDQSQATANVEFGSFRVAICCTFPVDIGRYLKFTGLSCIPHLSVRDSSCALPCTTYRGPIVGNNALLGEKSSWKYIFFCLLHKFTARDKTYLGFQDQTCIELGTGTSLQVSACIIGKREDNHVDNICFIMDWIWQSPVSNL